jgi:hypothetical protein
VQKVMTIDLGFLDGSVSLKPTRTYKAILRLWFADQDHRKDAHDLGTITGYTPSLITLLKHRPALLQGVLGVTTAITPRRDSNSSRRRLNV